MRDLKLNESLHKRRAHLLVSLRALRSAEGLALSLPAFVPGGALGSGPGAQHWCLHIRCYLGLHLLKTPAQCERHRGEMERVRGGGGGVKAR